MQPAFRDRQLQKHYDQSFSEASDAESVYGEETYRKLVALKERYDPTNVFHLNQNIAP